MSDKTETSPKGSTKAPKPTRKSGANPPVAAAAKSNGGAKPAGEKAPPEGLRALALDYPLGLLAGGIVAGVLIGALLPRAGKSRLGKGAVALAGVAGELGLNYARKAIDNMADAARSASDVSGRVIEGVAERAGSAGETLSESAADYSDKAASAAVEAAEALRSSAQGFARQVIRLTSQLRH